MKNIKKKKIIFIFLFILFLLIPFFFVYFVFYQPPQPIKTRAQEEDDATFCQNHCTPAQGNQPDCRGKPDFYDEKCCLKIQQTGDPGKCPWPQRGWCMPEHCATIPEEVSRERCAAPRAFWCNMCKERCFKNLPSPAITPLPTSLPISPTEIVIEPTKPITIEPEPTKPIFSYSKPTTPFVFPTTIIHHLPTEETPPVIPTNIPFEPFEFKLPKLVLPTIKINLEEIKQKSDHIIEKPVGFFQWMFLKIKYYDQLLEKNINESLEKILNF